MPPVRAGEITAKTLGEGFGSSRTGHFIDYLTMSQPDLKIYRRGLDYRGGLEPLHLHIGDGVSCQVVDQAQAVQDEDGEFVVGGRLRQRADINMAGVEIL